MYLSYLMGADSITDSELRELNIKILENPDSDSRKLEIPDDSVHSYKELLYAKIDKGFWNEFINEKEIVFVFKFKDGHLAEYTLKAENKDEIANLCSEFNGDPIEKVSDLLKYLAENDFYTDIINKYHSALSHAPDRLASEPLLIYGTPHEDAIARQSVVAVIFNKKKDKILTLKWKVFACSGLVTGGIDGDESMEEAVRREIIEETGYTDFDIEQKLGREIVAYYHATNKNVWRKAEMHAYLVVLKSDQKQEQQLEEPEDFEVVWKTPAEYAEEIDKTEVSEKNDFRPYRIFLQRGIEVFEDEEDIRVANSRLGDDTIPAEEVWKELDL